LSTLITVDEWIQENSLEAKVWNDSSQQQIAYNQAIRNLQRWYPEETEFTDEVVAYQVIWEIQGIDPALKYQKQGVKYVSDSGERIDYLERDRVAPDVREILGPPLFELEEGVAGVELYGGGLL
jgi:hypothetical protein